MTTEVAIIWNDFHKELKAYIQNKTRNAADTDDILQDVFIKIIQNFDKVAQSGNMRNYLYGIVRNAVFDYFRKRKLTTGTSELEEVFSGEEINSLNETIAECCIKPFINKLPEHYREALLIVELQEISQKELAEKLNITYSTAKSRVQRGKAKLKELIIECCPYKSDSYGNIISEDEKKCGCS